MTTDQQHPAPPASGYDAYAYMAKDADRFEAATTPASGLPVQDTPEGRHGFLAALGPKRVLAVVGVVAAALAIGGVAIASTRGTPASNLQNGRGGFGGPPGQFGGGQFGGGQGRFGQQGQQGQGQLGQGQPGQGQPGQGQPGQGQPGQGQVGQQGPGQQSQQGSVPALPPNKTSDDPTNDSSSAVTTSLTT